MRPLNATPPKRGINQCTLRGLNQGTLKKKKKKMNINNILQLQKDAVLQAFDSPTGEGWIFGICKNSGYIHFAKLINPKTDTWVTLPGVLNQHIDPFQLNMGTVVQLAYRGVQGQTQEHDQADFLSNHQYGCSFRLSNFFLEQVKQGSRLSTFNNPAGLTKVLNGSIVAKHEITILGNSHTHTVTMMNQFRFEPYTNQQEIMSETGSESNSDVSDASSEGLNSNISNSFNSSPTINNSSTNMSTSSNSSPSSSDNSSTWEASKFSHDTNLDFDPQKGPWNYKTGQDVDTQVNSIDVDTQVTTVSTFFLFGV